MAMRNSADARFPAEGQTGHSPELSGVGIRREGLVEPFLHANRRCRALPWDGRGSRSMTARPCSCGSSTMRADFCSES
jgi:hypothetical protein